ncbi:MAG: polyphosphate kinase 1, partial [Saprospiraceae bacterium]|nr:polyphosphate kinase 1 [Saprospiraceae bacterium]
LSNSEVQDVMFENLLVGQFNLRSTLINLIDFEIKQAKLGNKAKIILKMNSLEDSQMIEKLYEADQAGVEITLIIRGINCLIPGIEGISSNIKVISIVDRYLEHSRIFMFHAGGKNLIYLSSADWMVRNLSYRIETAFPIYNPELKKFVSDIIDIQLSDNTKARKLDGVTDSVMVKNGKSFVNSQQQTYKMIKNLRHPKKK